METEHRIQPERITKPIQLLAAWLVGLIVVDASFLISASRMSDGGWERGALVAAAIVNVPLFLFALFLLQTRFRPELQEDSYYAQYLDKRTNELVTVRREDVVEKELVSLRAEIRAIGLPQSTSAAPAESAETPTSTYRLTVALNRHLLDVRPILKNASIPIADVFGTKEAPGRRVMAMGHHVPFRVKLSLLRLAPDMRLDGYSYFNPAEEDIEEDVLIGAYGKLQFPITAELQRVLNDSPEPVDLRLYEAQQRSD